MSEKSKRYPAQVFWSDEDEGYIAIAPDLPGCSAFGETADEAIRELDAAQEAWLAAAIAAGNPIPEPSPAPSAQHSGKVLVRMPRDLHTQLARRAEAEAASLNQYIVYLLAAGVSQSQPVSPVPLEQHLSTALAESLLTAHPGGSPKRKASQSDIQRLAAALLVGNTRPTAWDLDPNLIATFLGGTSIATGGNCRAISGERTYWWDARVLDPVEHAVFLTTKPTAKTASRSRQRAKQDG